MLVAVGSTNPVKIEAVKRVVEKVWPGSKVVKIAVASGVSDQPRSEGEARRGALNRAKHALRNSNADFGVGLEGAIRHVPNHGYFITPWCAVINKTGIVSFSHGAAPILPDKFKKEIFLGKELGTVIDEATGQTGLKHREGVFGLLTKNIVTRVMAYEQMVAFAFTRFIAPEFYD
jgi:inosine/xanthosine triphosphatase